MSMDDLPAIVPDDEHNVGIDPHQELYVVTTAGQMQLHEFDAVMERIERYSIELLIDSPPAPARGSREAYDTMRNLQEALRMRFERTGEPAVAELSPQLHGLEGRRVIAVTHSGDQREFEVGLESGTFLPRHVELRSDGRVVPACREYERVDEVR